MEESIIFYSLMSNTAQEENLTLQQLKAKCAYSKDEAEVSAMLILNKPEVDPKLSEKRKAIERIKSMTFDSYEVVYDYQSWRFLRRQILGNHPGTPKSFMKECEVLFDGIEFHASCECALLPLYLEASPRKIVKYLSALNDCWTYIEKEYGDSYQANTLLEDLSGRCGLDKCGSIERNSAKKEVLTFAFANSDGKMVEVYCELHLKISTPDDNYEVPSDFDIREFNPRLYFAAPIEDVANGKILMGRIGPHS